MAGSPTPYSPAAFFLFHFSVSEVAPATLKRVYASVMYVCTCVCVCIFVVLLRLCVCRCVSAFEYVSVDVFYSRHPDE